MVVVDDLREPIPEKDPVDRFGFWQRRHVKVPVVVVARVFVVELWNPIGRTPVRLAFAHVPVGDELHAVGIHEAVEYDNVIQKSGGFRIRAAHELIDALDELLRPQNFRRMDSTIDPDHGFTFSGESAGLIVRYAFGMGKALRDFLISSQLLMVLRRSDDRQVDRPAFGRFANLLDVYSIGFVVELLQVIDVLRIVDQNVVVADVEAKLLLRRCDSALRLKPGCRHQKDQEQMSGGTSPVR